MYKMADKLKYDYVKNFINIESESGCELISKTYEGNSKKLEIRCKCGNIFEVSFNSFKDDNKRQCNECSQREKHNRIYNEKRVNKILDLYTKNKTMEEIAQIVGTKPQTVSKILKENNINIRNTASYYTSKELATTRKYYFNEDYFEIIDTSEKAYWLGFLYADGNVYIPKINEGKTKGGRIEIALKADDDYHLYNFVNCLNGNMPIKYRDITLNDNIYKSCRLQIGSMKMALDLMNHGCIPNKSLILEFPKFLSDNLLPHFIRGYIDGDGCVGFNIYEFTDSFTVSVLGTQNFLYDLKVVLEKNKIKCSDIKPQKSKAYCLYITGRDNLVTLYNYLYTDATIFLGRKIDKFREALIYFDKEFNISDVAKMFVLLDDDLLDKISYRKHGRKLKKKMA
jgi:hypothetical protein